MPEFWLRVVCKRNEEARDADLIHTDIDTPQIYSVYIYIGCVTRGLRSSRRWMYGGNGREAGLAEDRADCVKNRRLDAARLERCQVKSVDAEQKRGEDDQRARQTGW